MKTQQEVRLWIAMVGLVMAGVGLWLISPAYALIGVGSVLFIGLMALSFSKG